MDYETRCSGCKHFEFAEYWNGDEELEVFICHKKHYDHIGWYRPPCEDYEEE